MMQGTIQEFGKSKSGNPKVKIDDRWYSIKSVDNMAMGRRIDFDCHEFQFSGKQFWEVDSWGYIPEASNGVHRAPAPSQTPVAPRSVPTPAPMPQPSAAPTASQAALTEPELRFISNCVGNAIAAKTIQDPIDLIAWVKGARAALESLNDGGF